MKRDDLPVYIALGDGIEIEEAEFADSASGKHLGSIAADSADTTQQYSGKPPIIQEDYWWVWNATTGEYENTGESARGDVMYATFEIDPEIGLLTMTTPTRYDGPTFVIVNGYLEVSVNA